MLVKTLASKSKGVVVLTILAVAVAGCGSSPKADAWKTGTIMENGTVAGCPIGTVLVGKPKELAGQVKIRMVDTLCEDKECRIVAVDNEGRIRLGKGNVTLVPGGNCRSTVVVFSGIKLEEITEFRFQSRPYQQKTVHNSQKSPPVVSAVQKARLINAASKGELFESNYFN